MDFRLRFVGTGVLDGPWTDDMVKRTAREGGPYEENLDGAAMRFVGKEFIPSAFLRNINPSSTASGPPSPTRGKALKYGRFWIIL